MSNQQPGTGKKRSAVLIAASLVFLIFNLSFIYQGFFVRHRADDYCFTGFQYQFGYWRGLSQFYNTTSNRFSAYLVSGLTEFLGLAGIRLLAPLTILIFILSTYLAVSWLRLTKSNNGLDLPALLLSQMIAFFALYLAPNRHQSLYWRSGLIHYFLPVPVLIFLIMLVFKDHPINDRHPIALLLILLIALINAGLSESAAALQTTAVVLSIIYYFLFHPSTEIRPFIFRAGAALAGSLAAMAIMVISPGNALRLETIEQAGSTWTVIAITFDSTLSFINLSLRGAWLPFTVLFVLSGMVPLAINETNGQEAVRNKNKVLFFLLASLILIAAVCAPTAYGMQTYPELRVLMLAMIALVAAVSTAGFLVGKLITPVMIKIDRIQTLALFGIFILSLYPLRIARYRMMEIDFYQERAAEWDNIHADIQDKIAEGETTLTVPAVDSFSEMAEMRPDNNFWVNVCAARYYQIDSIIAVEK